LRITPPDEKEESMSRLFTYGLRAVVAGLLCWCCLAAAGERFSDNGDGTVSDHQLGVMWAKTDNQGDISWKEALQWITYTFPGTIQVSYDDWRMPTLAELQSLYVNDPNYPGYETDCGQHIKIVPQIRLSCGWVWSSERNPAAPSAAVYNFNRGYHYTDRLVHKKAYRALAVRDLK
jgi:hypothetical protein